MPTKYVCAWCKNEFGTTDSQMHDENTISHGICPPCHKLEMKEIDARVSFSSQTKFV